MTGDNGVLPPLLMMLEPSPAGGGYRCAKGLAAASATGAVSSEATLDIVSDGFLLELSAAPGGGDQGAGAT